MKRFIFTFGQNHAHRINGKTVDKDCVAVVEAKDEFKARVFMREQTNNRYGTSYPEEIFDRNGTIKFFPRGKIAVN